MVSSASSTYGHPEGQNQIYPDRGKVLPSAPLALPDISYSQFGVSLRPDNQQNRTSAAQGQRHKNTSRHTEPQESTTKSVPPREVHSAIPELGNTDPYYPQEDEQEILHKQKGSEQEEDKSKYTIVENEREKEKILKEINGKEWLSDLTIYRCTKILKDQFVNKIYGLLLPEENPEQAVPKQQNGKVPRAQVLYDDNHWTLSLSTKPGEVYYVDSDKDSLPEGETKRVLSDNLKKQMIRTHGVPHQGAIDPIWLNVQQQDNNIDCGVFV